MLTAGKHDELGERTSFLIVESILVCTVCATVKCSVCHPSLDVTEEWSKRTVVKECESVPLWLNPLCVVYHRLGRLYNILIAALEGLCVSGGTGRYHTAMRTDCCIDIPI